MRRRIYALVEKTDNPSKLSKLYQLFILAVAFLSIIPLMVKEGDNIPIFQLIDRITVYLLFFDYILRWICFDFTAKTKGYRAFLKYPLTGFAIIDLISLLPSLGLLGGHFRILRMLRIFKILHYSENFVYIINVFKKERKTLISVLIIALTYIFISALAMFSYEPDTFDNFFGALYWATTALTTVGYGDVYPMSGVGQLISMVSSLFGIAVIALPAGVITAGFMTEINRDDHDEQTLTATPTTTAMPTLPKKKLFRYGAIMAAGVLINQLLSSLAEHFALPIWLDTVGTILVTLILEPAAGLLVGLLDNFYLSIIMQDSSKIFYYSISAVVVIITGVFMKKDKKIKAKRILPAFILVILCSTILSTLLTIIRTNGLPDNAFERHFASLALTWGFPGYFACSFGILVVKTFDTFATAIMVTALFQLYRTVASRRSFNLSNK